MPCEARSRTTEAERGAARESQGRLARLEQATAAAIATTAAAVREAERAFEEAKEAAENSIAQHHEAITRSEGLVEMLRAEIRNQ